MLGGGGGASYGGPQRPKLVFPLISAPLRLGNENFLGSDPLFPNVLYHRMWRMSNITCLSSTSQWTCKWCRVSPLTLRY